MAFYDEPKKKPQNNISDLPTSPDPYQDQEQQNDMESDAFAKWIKDKLRSDRRRMVEID